MGDIVTTVVGRMTNEAVCRQIDGGREVVTFRMACNHRYFDRAVGLWKEASTSFVTVDCWRYGLGRNVMASFAKGDPVIVHGRMMVREFEQGGRPRTAVTLVADAVGPDLNYAIAALTRTRHNGGSASAVHTPGTEGEGAEATRVPRQRPPGIEQHPEVHVGADGGTRGGAQDEAQDAVARPEDGEGSRQPAEREPAASVH